MNASYRYMDPDMIFTSNREEVLDCIQGGEWVCALCPQMFGYEGGCYGLFASDKPKKRTCEEAEAWLSEFERSGRRAFNDETLNPDGPPSDIPENLLPGKI